jgi:hypothetical protein
MSGRHGAVVLGISTAVRLFAGREAVSVHVCSRRLRLVLGCHGHAHQGVSTAEQAHQDPGDDVGVSVVRVGCCWRWRFK